MRLVIAGGQPLSQRAISLLVTTKLGVEVAGEAGSYEELMKLVEIVTPDLILLAGELPGVNLDELITTLHGLENSTSVIVLNERPEMEKSALAAGAEAFVHKGSPPMQLLFAIEAVRMEKENLKQP